MLQKWIFFSKSVDEPEAQEVWAETRQEFRVKMKMVRKILELDCLVLSNVS